MDTFACAESYHESAGRYRGLPESDRRRGYSALGRFGRFGSDRDARDWGV